MWNINFNIIVFLTELIAWAIIGFIAFRIYRKLSIKPRIWKVGLVILFGLFSFSINWTMFDTLIRISILPLGVWILYAVLKGKEGRWQTYRGFAWLGFWANYIFLAATLIALPIHQAIYPEEKPSTYISDISNASIIKTHPTGNKMLLNKDLLISQLDTFDQDRIMSDVWYEETYMNTDDSNKINERFPYLLTEVKSKWGSGINSTIYIEEDGAGILISTADRQYYFRSDSSVLKEGRQSE
ncbi:hypothetical protein [Bacillus suaedae]|uniref:hypothetical protein n=1 Tax=Halalkalibacter suaedae TaxID=2822140 RepID=UPI001FF0B0A2|nr:hypothetical protein [Bacillus suaedae]